MGTSVAIPLAHTRAQFSELYFAHKFLNYIRKWQFILCRADVDGVQRSRSADSLFPRSLALALSSVSPFKPKFNAEMFFFYFIYLAFEARIMTV